jgi:hypothetical protein
MDKDEPSDHPERTFSLMEANVLIPHLREQFLRIKTARSVILKIGGEIRKASTNMEMGGGSPYGSLYIRTLEDIATGMQSLQETGVLIKDLESGLCDFPHLSAGRIVYLCWQLGEEEIRWWHEITSGFQGRQPLESLTK